MKTGEARAQAPGDVVSSGADPRDPAAGPVHGDGRTREAVARLLMERGPVAAAEVADVLGLSGPAVRRHLDALIADGEAQLAKPARHGPRGRGRPARHYTLTDTGRVRFGHGYDDLAVAALRYLGEHGGEAAVRGFARARVSELIGPGARQQISAAQGIDARTAALARVLSSRGYAAQARSAGAGVQLCQHHCPVAHVAAEFPQLCEAETREFAEILGTHVQRLATIARGDAACTTHVPLPAPEPGRRAPDLRTRGPDRPDAPAAAPATQLCTELTGALPTARTPAQPTTTPTARSPIGRQSQ